MSVDLYPCDLLFIHRDAENAPSGHRFSEINLAVQEAQNLIQVPPTVGVVPVRMLETWLLFDLHAIGRAAGNPHGTRSLNLPALRTLENLTNPKETLYQILREASGLSGRRLRSFNQGTALHRIPDCIDDFSPLRALSAFKTLETRIKQALRSFGLNRSSSMH